MNTKYLFLDIDGTLVGFDGVMPSSASEALKKAHENGHKLVICTGRQLSQVYPWLLKEIPFDGLILSGGAMVINEGGSSSLYKSKQSQKTDRLLREQQHRILSANSEFSRIQKMVRRPHAFTL